MKIRSLLLSLIIPAGLLMAQADAKIEFEPNIKCKKCHPEIYKEYETSMHAKSTVFADAIHKAVWENHPLSKEEKYQCAKCHTPTANNLADMLGEGTKGAPDATNETHTEGILCAYCHRIEAIDEGHMSNTNKILKENDEYFGTLKDPVRSRKHYQTYNESFKNGKVCMGCHSHKKNREKLDVCTTEMGNDIENENCITCHMPKVPGNVSTKNDTPSYAFHGFPGANNAKEKLLHYVNLKFAQEEKGFKVTITNRSPHNLLLHPLRLVELRATLERDGKMQELKTEKFFRTLGKDGAPTDVWLANAIVQDTMIKGKESREVLYDTELLKGDKINLMLGYFLVNPKALEKLGLQENEQAKEFHILQEKTYTVE